MRPYFYKTINTINGKYYYGSGSKSGYIGSGTILAQAITKYGKENFETHILREFDTRDQAFAFEDRFLKLYNIAQDPMAYNIKNEAKGGDTYSNHPDLENIRIKLSKSARRYQSPDTRKKIADTKTGVPLSESHRQSISDNHHDVTGENNPMYGRTHSTEAKEKMKERASRLSEEDKAKRAKENAAVWADKIRGKSHEEIYGKEKADEINRRRSKSLKGRKFSEEHRRKLSEAAKNRKRKSKH